MFRFQDPKYLWLLILPAIIIILFIIANYLNQRNIKKIGNIKLLKLLIPNISLARKIWKLVFICLALASMVIALARPQFASKLEEITTQGIEIIVALDVSNSMMAQDIKPNRLSNAKRFIEKTLGKLKNDKFGLIVFAGDALVQMPITNDVNSARIYLSTINTNMVPVQGTSISKALDLASKSFSKDAESSKVIILITDGENHEGDVVSIAKNLKEKNIKVFTIGVGLPSGAPIPETNGKGFMKDREGNVVMSIPDEATLIKVANITDGIYVRMGNSPNSTDIIFEELSKIDKNEIVKQQYSDYEDKFIYFVLLALILLIADSLLSERKNDAFKNIRLFNREI
jgi:Ca-activated chloride channel family protein